MAFRVRGGMDVWVLGDHEKSTSPRSRMRVVAFVIDMREYVRRGEKRRRKGWDTDRRNEGGEHGQILIGCMRQGDNDRGDLTGQVFTLEGKRLRVNIEFAIMPLTPVLPTFSSLRVAGYQVSGSSRQTHIRSGVCNDDESWLINARNVGMVP